VKTSHLALDHRPKQFSQLVGQSTAKVIITNGICNNRLGPVLLASGPRGSGKTSTARLIAMALNCRKRKPTSAEPCGKCNSCIRLSEPDPQWSSYLELDAGRAGGVDQIRDLADRLQQPIVEGTQRVVVIDEAHGLTGPAATAALKLLEEPPARTFILLLTTHPHKLLPTIRSRCQEIRFEELSSDEILSALESAETSVTSETLAAIAGAVDGDLRRAFNLVQSAQAGLTAEKLFFSENGLDVLAADLLVQLSVSDLPAAIDRIRAMVGKSQDLVGAQRAIAEISNQVWALSALHADRNATPSLLGVSAVAGAKLKEALENTHADQVSRWMQQLTASWSMVSSGLMRPEAAVGMAVVQLMQASKPPAQAAQLGHPQETLSQQGDSKICSSSGEAGPSFEERWKAIADELDTALVAKLEKCDLAFNGTELQVTGSGLTIRRLQGSIGKLEERLSAFGLTAVTLASR
jgi:DNA polymerase III subunit gamma/tau